MNEDREEQQKYRCGKCNFDDEFITDFDEHGEEYVFCGNCGTIRPQEKTVSEFDVYGNDCPRGGCE